MACGKPITQFSGKEQPTLFLKPAHSNHCWLGQLLGLTTLLLGCVNPHVPVFPFALSPLFHQMSTLCLGSVFGLVHPLVIQPGRMHRIPGVCNLPKRKALSTSEPPLWVLVSRFTHSTQLFVPATRLRLANSDSPLLVTIQ